MTKIEVAVNIKRTKNGFTFEAPLQKAAQKKLENAIELGKSQLVHISFTTKDVKK